MAEHENCIGESDDWHTPPELFAALARGGLRRFDLDVSTPLDRRFYFVPADRIYTIEDDGLVQPWFGVVFMNPPYGGGGERKRREGHIPWLVKFLDHSNGVAIVRAYTSSRWFHQHVIPRAQTLLFPRGNWRECL
jgi:hypothetical protein